MSTLSLAEEEKYQKKYLKYKEKYFLLQKELNGGSAWKSFKTVAKKGASVASSAASHPLVQSVASNAAMIASQNPNVQAKLSQAQQYYNKSPTAQFATQVAMSHPKVQSVLSHPVTQQVASQVAPINKLDQEQDPDEIWNTLTLEQKQHLISMLH